METPDVGYGEELPLPSKLQFGWEFVLETLFHKYVLRGKKCNNIRYSLRKEIFYKGQSFSYIPGVFLIKKMLYMKQKSIYSVLLIVK
jgi:hypothetical protein